MLVIPNYTPSQFEVFFSFFSDLLEAFWNSFDTFGTTPPIQTPPLVYLPFFAPKPITGPSENSSSLFRMSINHYPNI